ncbi:MAG: pseudouridine synthase [Patescibacteria group bacterium]|nr:pseudouridine synthase [Patescibacteria group bacterium]
MRKINLQKYIASCGICSRRKAEQLIINQKIKINEKIAKVTDRVNEGDVVKFSNKIIKPEKNKIYIVLNKPTGYTCTAKTFKNEKNIFSLINIKERLFTIGRLDKESSGLLILTNDGNLALKLSHPRYKHEKKYEITVDQKIKKEQISRLLSGVLIKNENDEYLAKTKKAEKITDNKILITITEGKKRQIRYMMEAVGLKTISLKRIKISGLSLGDLALGKTRHLTKKEIEDLL